MTNPARFLPVILAAVGSALAGARAGEPAILAKARAYLGPDAVLSAVTSVHYTGTLITMENTPAGPKPSTATIEIIFQKPLQQRITATSEKSIETTALDNYDGWQRLQDAKDASRWQLKLLSKDQIKRLRANTWENLAYYSDFARGGVKLEDLGPVSVGPVACEKVAFRHDTDIVFLRYFDQASGRLVLTETEQGGSIREEGEMLVGGIRFPKKIITVSREADGKERSITVTFDQITVNEKFPGSAFTVPGFTTK